MRKVKLQLGFRNAFMVPCKKLVTRKGKRVSRAGGLCLLWTDEVKVSVLSYSESHIDVIVSEDTSL